MGNLLRLDESLNLALTCHPNLKKFLEGIRDESALFLNYCDPAKLNQYCKSARGDVFRVESSWRTFRAQDELYNKTRFNWTDKVGEKYGPHVTYVKGGGSHHNWGLAVDLVFTRTGYGAAFYNQKNYQDTGLAALYEDCGLVAYAKACGCRWLGRDMKLADVVHFETFHLPVEARRKDERLAVSGWWEKEDMNVVSVKDSPLVSFGNKFLIAAVALGAVWIIANRKKR